MSDTAGMVKFANENHWNLVSSCKEPEILRGVIYPPPPPPIATYVMRDTLAIAWLIFAS